MTASKGVWGHSLIITMLALGLWGSAAARVMVETEGIARNPTAVMTAPETRCAGCHESEHHQWLTSHHAKALSPLTDLDTSAITDLSEHEKPVLIIGHEPLQQVLVATKNGHLHAHPLAYDTKQQQWFDLYPQAAGNPSHPMHWRQPAHLANTQCLSCHVTDYQTGYQPQTLKFESSWQAMGVGCQSCHGPTEAHLQWAGGQQTLPNKGFTLQLSAAEQQLQVCAQCHSRRNELQPFKPTVAIHQQFLVSPLSADLYEVDGTIKDEVFEYGSFIQSKMHQAGVTCSNCHNAHSGELKAPGNAVCSQCHSSDGQAQSTASIDGTNLKAKNYDSSDHHFHQADSSGGQCVNCHMPGQLYMGNDLRHDHSFSSPNPSQALALRHSDACIDCHQQTPVKELVSAFSSWYPQAKPRDGGYAQTLFNARNGQPGAAQGLLLQLQAGKQPAIRHAALLAELGNYPSLAAQRLTVQGLQHADPLVRRAAIEVAPTLFTEAWLMRNLPILLEDSQQAVRITAIEQLLSLGYRFVKPQEVTYLKAYAGLQQHHLGTAQGHFNLATVAATHGQPPSQVKAHLQAALMRNAQDIPTVIEFAQWLEKTDPQAAKAILESAIALQPAAAELVYARGLMLIRQADFSAGLSDLAQAAQLAPDSSHYAYVLAIALYDSGQHEAARELLRSALKQSPQQRQLRMALWQYTSVPAERQRLLEQLRQLNPFDPWLDRQ